MVKENQPINIIIPRNNIKEYYESKGYVISKIGEQITIEAKDISPGSKIKIVYICDYCGKEYIRTPWSNNRAKKMA